MENGCSVAVDTIAEIIDKMAAEMKGSLENGDSGDIKQLKELTLAAKELAAVIRGLEGDEVEDSGASINVVLEGEIEKMGKVTLKIPKPSPRQKLFLTDTHRYIAFGGARGGGKKLGCTH